MAAPAEGSKPISDVSKPGQTGATPTTRPIIISHGGMMKDPMVSGSAAASDLEEEAKPVAPVIQTPTRAKVIQPVSVEPPKTEPSEKPAEAEQEAPEESTASPEPVSDEAVVDAVIEQATTKKKDGRLSEEEIKQQEAINKLITDKTYFVPIGQVRRRHRRYALLVSLVIALLVVGGLTYAIQSGRLKLDSIFSSSKVADTSDTPRPVAVAPIAPVAPKLTAFSNKDVGMSFSYPAEWGSATVTTNAKETTEKGKRTIITFASQPHVSIGLKSADWKDTSKDVNRACTQPGFTAYVAQKTDLGNGRRVVLDKPSLQVYEELTGGLCDDTELTGNVKFAKTTVYPGASVLYQSKVEDKFDLAQRIADYKKDYNKYFPDSLRQQIISLTSSIVQL